MSLVEVDGAGWRCVHSLVIPILNFWTFDQQYYKNESIHLNFWHHSHNKQKDGLETQVIFVDIFAWTWNIWGGHSKKCKTVKNGSFCEELLSENDFEVVFVNFCCYDYGANASETVQKISTRTLELYANSLKQLILLLYLWKNTFNSLLPAYWRCKPGFCFFPWHK